MTYSYLLSAFQAFAASQGKEKETGITKMGERVEGEGPSDGFSCFAHRRCNKNKAEKKNHN